MSTRTQQGEPGKCWEELATLMWRDPDAWGGMQGFDASSLNAEASQHFSGCFAFFFFFFLLLCVGCAYV
jgi:hypothetical protein